MGTEKNAKVLIENINKSVREGERNIRYVKFGINIVKRFLIDPIEHQKYERIEKLLKDLETVFSRFTIELDFEDSNISFNVPVFNEKLEYAKINHYTFSDSKVGIKLPEKALIDLALYFNIVLQKDLELKNLIESLGIKDYQSFAVTQLMSELNRYTS